MIEYKTLEQVKAENNNKLSAPRIEKAFRAEAGATPKFVPGKYGKKYDYHKCGNCGKILEIVDNFCGGCGFRINWANPRCLTGVH